MSYSYEHLIVMPIVLPLVSAALMLLIDERNRSLRAAINVVSILILLGVAVALLRFADTPTANASGSVGVYLLGSWSAPFGIVLVADRLSALMLVLTTFLRWPRWCFRSHAGTEQACISMYWSNFSSWA